MNGIKCRYCKGYESCPYRDDLDDTCWYEPNDYDCKDIGSATAVEVRKQNEGNN